MNQCPNIASCENWNDKQGCVVMNTNEILRNDAQNIIDNPPELADFFGGGYTDVYSSASHAMNSQRFNPEVIGKICHKMLDSGESAQQIADGMLGGYEHNIRKIKIENLTTIVAK